MSGVAAVRRRPLIAILGLGIGVAVSLGAMYLVLHARSTVEVDCQAFRFDRDAWTRPWPSGDWEPAPGNERFTRSQVMARGLVRCGALTDQTKTQVRAILGPPPDAETAEQRWEYPVGPGQSLFGRSSNSEESLYVEFDHAGVVEDTGVSTRRF